MYQVNDVIVYGYSEVCKIEKIGRLDFTGNKELYYTLRPICNNASVLYVKVEKVQKTLRSITDKDTAQTFLKGFQSIEPLYDKNDKLREKQFQAIINDCNFLQCLQIFKGISIEKEHRSLDGKKLSIVDERQLQKVETSLAAEFSIIFHISLNEAKEKMHAFSF